jgi:diguanylate cyclase (GGDEF)-like protein/PAS domain S-box-containing protein
LRLTHSKEFQMASSVAHAEVAVRMPRAAALHRDPVLLGIAAYSAAVCIFFASGWGGLRAQTIWMWVLQIPFDFTLFVLCRRVVRLPGMPKAARRFWNYFGISGLFYCVGDISQSVLAPGLPPLEAALPGVVKQVTLVLGVALPVSAMLAFPTPSGSRREQVRFWLDAGTVMAAALVFAWYVSVSAGSAVPSAANLRGTLPGVGVELVAAFAVVKLLLTGTAGFVREAGLCGAFGCAVLGLGNAAVPSLLHSHYLYLLLAVQVVGAGPLFIPPRIQELRVRTDPQAISGISKRPYSLLPYISIAATLALLVAALTQGLNIRAWGVLVGVIIITGLVVIRQLAAFTDNARLLFQLDEQEQLQRSLVRHASDITIISRNGKISYASPALDRVLGIPRETAIGQQTFAVVHPDDIAELANLLTELEATPHASVTYQHRVQHADGSWRWLEVISTNLLEDPAVNGIVSNARDITAAREHQEMLRHQASHDPLTQLPNRALFTERAQAAAAGDQPHRMAILLIDLDDFKNVNDTLGHHVGDELLIGVADRLRSCIRPGDTIARLGGDEFAVLLPVAQEDDATALAERVMASLVTPISAAGHQLVAHASVGLALDISNDPEGLLRAADLAMYAAKRGGKGTYARHEIEQLA